jgi:high affinity Mn2+ porin
MKGHTQLANLAVRCFVLVLWAAATLGLALPAQAQQPDAPSAASPADPSADDSPETTLPHFKDTRFWVSGQANFIFQTHPPFPAAYSGVHSLGPNYEKATSRVMTLYTGVRLNDTTELLVDIEEAGGTALSSGFGLAGNTDLDIVRNPLLSKEPYLGRGVIHKVFALSKDKVDNQRNFLSLFAELPRRRLEIRFGKFSMPDFFDVNSVGSDTHLQFINWTTDNNGAYDYAADTRGYTVGATADFEDRNWGFRFAEVLMPKVANGIDLVWKPWQAHAENFEYELRHGLIPKKSGVVRLLAYTNYANMGIYRDAISNFEAGLTPPRRSPTIPGTSRASTALASISSRIFCLTSRPSPASDGITARPNPSPIPKSIRLSPRDSAPTEPGGTANRIAPALPSSATQSAKIIRPTSPMAASASCSATAT